MQPLNMDFSKRVVVDSNTLDWLSSPQKGVSRKPLARENQESGHATSIVRYQVGAHFSAHNHPMGEEIFVLEGTFSDDDGDYPQGTYIRNPPGSSHRPFSTDGCTLFVKLNQFDPKDMKRVRVDTNIQPWQPGVGGLKVMELHDFEGQHTALVKWSADEAFQSHRHFGGEEILVLCGQINDEHGSYPANTWMRSPHLSVHQPFVSRETIILVKVGHLPA
ncbi:cupin domain-containing protein [Shewanella atlantica]|uniref:cupin domain-containing protein n=1 Tax=Shewanella atlantica TaxID=271099 RepID=UPI00373513C9